MSRGLGDVYKRQEDNGNTWKDITDSLGNRVSAQGEKGEQGNQGDPGQTGEKGDPGDKGDNGENVYLQSNGTELQWKMGEDGEWQTLILLSEIKGGRIDQCVSRS